MVDINKRTTIKTIGSVAAIMATPAIAAAGTHNDLLKSANDEQHANIAAVQPFSGAELSIELSVESDSTVRLTNHSDQPLVVKHVYPGLIHAGAQTFDINSVLKKNPVAMSPGESRIIKIKPNTHLQSEAYYPREQYRNQPQRIVALTGKDSAGEIVNSTRSFYS